MKKLGVQGIIRGKAKKTTAPDKSQPCLKDKVNGKFRAPAPNMLWVSDFTCFSRSQGFVYVTFIIDTFADKIVGWRVSSSPKTDFVLDALDAVEQWNKPCMIAAPFIKVASLTTPTATGHIVHSLYRTIGRCWHRSLGGQRWQSL